LHGIPYSSPSPTFSEKVSYITKSNHIAAACTMICVAGGRYEKVENGLRIHNVTSSDQGQYICRAEVQTDGRYDERRITLLVRRKCQGRVQDFSLEGAGQDRRTEDRQRGWSSWGRGQKSPPCQLGGLGSAVISFSRVWGGAPTAQSISTYCQQSG